jgi:hypothetical protein
MSSDPTFGEATKDFRSGGWIVAFLSMASVLVKMLVSGKHYTKSVWVKNSIAGLLCGVVCYYSLHSAPINGMFKSILMCTCGAFAPQGIDYLKILITRKTNEAKAQEKKAQVHGEVRRRRSRPRS